MANRVLLDNVAHQNLKVAVRHGAEFGDNVNQVLVFPTEYAEIQREYPILFRKDANDDYVSVAILGLDRDENLYLDGDKWNARYVPAVQARGPFLIGLPKQDGGGATRPEPTINIDLDDPRVNEIEGESLFLPHGGNSPYLERIARTLQAIHQGVELSKRMFAALEAAALIEPVKVEVSLGDGEKYGVSSCYTISQERLTGLDGATLESLNKNGFLQLAFWAVSSLGNVNRLIELKRQKRAKRMA